MHALSVGTIMLDHLEVVLQAIHESPNMWARY